MKRVNYKINDAMEIACNEVAERTMGAARITAEHMIWDRIEKALGIPARKWYFYVDGSWMMLE